MLWIFPQVFCKIRDAIRTNHLCKFVHKGDCSRGVDYINETVRNLRSIQIAEHSNPAQISEPAYVRIIEELSLEFVPQTLKHCCQK